MFSDHTSFLVDLFLAAGPLEPARKVLILHQRPRIAKYVWIEVIPDLVLRVDFSLACRSCQRCAAMDCCETRDHLPG